MSPGRAGEHTLPPAPVVADSMASVGHQISLGWVSAVVALRHVLGWFET